AGPPPCASCSGWVWVAPGLRSSSTVRSLPTSVSSAAARQERILTLHSKMSDLLLDYEGLEFLAARDDIFGGLSDGAWHARHPECCRNAPTGNGMCGPSLRFSL